MLQKFVHQAIKSNVWAFVAILFILILLFRAYEKNQDKHGGHNFKIKRRNSDIIEIVLWKTVGENPTPEKSL